MTKLDLLLILLVNLSVQFSQTLGYIINIKTFQQGEKEKGRWGNRKRGRGTETDRQAQVNQEAKKRTERRKTRNLGREYTTENCNKGKSNEDRLNGRDAEQRHPITPTDLPGGVYWRR